MYPCYNPKEGVGRSWIDKNLESAKKANVTSAPAVNAGVPRKAARKGRAVRTYNIGAVQQS
jgi:hypothetical protein